MVIALIGLILSHSDPSSWVSDALRAEFTSTSYGPEDAPKQLAQPAGAVRTVRNN
jgi:hypothetical protein